MGWMGAPRASQRALFYAGVRWSQGDLQKEVTPSRGSKDGWRVRPEVHRPRGAGTARSGLWLQGWEWGLGVVGPAELWRGATAWSLHAGPEVSYSRLVSAFQKEGPFGFRGQEDWTRYPQGPLQPCRNAPEWGLHAFPLIHRYPTGISDKKEASQGGTLTT